jgi:acidic type I keratin
MMMGGGPGGGPGGGGPHGSSGGRGGGGFTGGSHGSSGGRGGGGRGGSSDYRSSLSFSVSAHNVLNHVNLNSPVADLSSPLFGQSTNVGGGFGGFGGGGDRGGSAGNRRIELQLRFSF